MIEVTEVKVYPIKNPKPDSSLVAFAQITLNNEFIVTGIRLINGKQGLFVGFPQSVKKENDAKYYDICFPTTKDLRDNITSKIIAAYQPTTESKPVMATSDWE